ncbi:hypothetical protein P9112_001600 [Eukaryota sp. TZLM1-RC]
MFSDDNLSSMFFDGDLEQRTMYSNSFAIRYECYHEMYAHTDGLTGHILWPGATALCHHITSHTDRFTDSFVVELGSGTGIPGLFASMFAKHTFLTDYKDDILDRIRTNLALNPHISKDKVSIQLLNWTCPHHREEFSQVLRRNLLEPRRRRVLIGSDVIYNHGETQSLASTIASLLREGDVCLLVNSTHRYNPNKDEFITHLTENGLCVDESIDGDLIWSVIERG